MSTTVDDRLDPHSTRLHVRLDAGAWFTRLRGDTGLGSVGPRADVDDIGLSGSEVTPAFALEIDVERFRVRGSGFTTSTDGSRAVPEAYTFGTVSLAAGDIVRSSFDIDSAGVMVGYELYRSNATRPFPWSDPVTAIPAGGGIALTPVIGLQWLSMEQTFEGNGAREDVDGDWLAILAGLDVRVDIDLHEYVPFLDHLEIRGSGAAGPAFGDETGLMFTVRAMASLWFTPNVALTLGYQYMLNDVEDGDWHVDTSLAGLYAGGTVRF